MKSYVYQFKTISKNFSKRVFVGNITFRQAISPVDKVHYVLGFELKDLAGDNNFYQMFLHKSESTIRLKSIILNNMYMND